MTFNFTNTEKIMVGVILAIIMFFGFRECSNRKSQNELIDGIANYKDSAQFYSVKVNGKDVEIAYNQSLVLQSKEQLESVIKKNDTLAKLVKKYKDVKATIIIKTTTSIKHDTIPIDRPIPCDFAPIKVRRDSAYYNFVGTISPKFFSIDTLSIPNKQSLVIGTKKLGFLKGTEERAEIVNSNPLIRTSNIESYVINKPKKWYQTDAFLIGTSLIGGYIIATQTTK